MIVTPGQLNRRAELYHQLGSMIAAGIPLMQALETVSRNPSIRVSQKVLIELIQHLKTGLTFSESMVRVHGWMPQFDIALLSVGEETGRLDQSFKQLANYYSQRAQIIRDTIAGMITTLATLHVFLLIFPLSYLISCALGIFNNNYSQCIPFILEKIVVFGALYGGTFFLIFASQGQRGESWRALVESLFGIVPVLCTARKYLALARLAAAMEALTSAGVPVVKGWELAAAAAGSPRLRREIESWKSPLASGVTPAELINKSSYFPEMFVNLYSTAELSGKLDEALGRLRIYYEEEGFRKLRLFTRLMNGTIYGLIVLLVGYTVIRFWVNYYGNMMNNF